MMLQFGGAVRIGVVAVVMFAVAIAQAAGGQIHEDTSVSFKRDVLPILETRCASCHMVGDSAGGLVLEPDFAYRMMVNVPSSEAPLLRVTPSAPQKSYVFLKVTNGYREAGGTGWRMPIGFVPLTASEIATLRHWIENGALQN